MPVTLRSGGRDTVPITGPRSRAQAAPEAIGDLSPAPGAQVRRNANMINPIGTGHSHEP